jgi:DNA-binding transcriptional regulator YdaS (Cro superfamily)
MTGIQEACDKLEGQNILAERLGVSAQAVSSWVIRGYVPLERVPEVAELTGVERVRLCDPRIRDALQLD